MRARFLLVTMAAILAAPALADTQAGVEAWQRGDYARAVGEWRTAANAGDADAAFNLGQAYKLGRGVPVDTQQAQAWYEKAALKGHVQAEDNYGLALFQNGRARDAIPYLEKSVARGEPRAQYILGTMLFNGTDIKRDWVRAYALTSRSAQSGLPQASQSLTQMDGYLSGADRKAGLALAAQMAGQSSAPATELAGRGSGGPGLRATDLPSSEAGRRPLAVPPEQAAQTPPFPVGAPRDEPVKAPRVAQVAPVRAPVTAVGGRWRLQLGAFGDAGNARRLGGQMAGRFAGRSIDYVRAGALTKVLVGPFASRAAALAACGSVSPCVAVAP